MAMTMVGEWRRCSPFARHSRFFAMNMINDGIGLLLGLAPAAARGARPSKPGVGSSERQVRIVDVLGHRDADAAPTPELVLGLRYERAHIRRWGYGPPECIQGGCNEFRKSVCGWLLCSGNGRLAGP